MIMKETELEGYIVRNGTGRLVFHTKEPHRNRESLLSDEELHQECLSNGQRKERVWYPRQWESNGKEISFKKLPFNEEIFNDLKWEDEPLKVKLICVIEK